VSTVQHSVCDWINQTDKKLLCCMVDIQAYGLAADLTFDEATEPLSKPFHMNTEGFDYWRLLTLHMFEEKLYTTKQALVSLQ
jgi:hypothetical protein